MACEDFKYRVACEDFKYRVACEDVPEIWNVLRRQVVSIYFNGTTLQLIHQNCLRTFYQLYSYKLFYQTLVNVVAKNTMCSLRGARCADLSKSSVCCHWKNFL